MLAAQQSNLNVEDMPKLVDFIYKKYFKLDQFFDFADIPVENPAKLEQFFKCYAEKAIKKGSKIGACNQLFKQAAYLNHIGILASILLCSDNEVRPTSVTSKSLC